VRRTNDIYQSRWREKGGDDPRVPALARLHARAHLLELPRALCSSRALASACTWRNGGEWCF
jgi:hypothetical protein